MIMTLVKMPVANLTITSHEPPTAIVQLNLMCPPV